MGRRVMARDSRFELLYMVGHDGFQISENIFSPSIAGQSSESAVGKDWRQRDWFLRVQRSGSPVITDVYRSVATNDFCFTVCAPISSGQSQMERILGVDVQLSSLL